MLTLLWGLPNDPILSALAGHLAGLGTSTIFLDQRDALESTLHLEVDPTVGGAITSGGRHIDLAEVTAIYLRPHDTRRIPAVARAGVGSEAWARALAFDQQC